MDFFQLSVSESDKRDDQKRLRNRLDEEINLLGTSVI